MLQFATMISYAQQIRTASQIVIVMIRSMIATVILGITRVDRNVYVLRPQPQSIHQFRHQCQTPLLFLHQRVRTTTFVPIIRIVHPTVRVTMDLTIVLVSGDITNHPMNNNVLKIGGFGRKLS